jgi:hypothetical protein
MGLRSKLRGYKAAIRVEQNRAAAVDLRQTDPALYKAILARAEGEAAETAKSDPDAYVALFLSFSRDEGLFDSSEKEDSGNAVADRSYMAMGTTPSPDADELEGEQMDELDQAMMDAVRTFFREQEWTFDELETGSFLVSFAGENGSWQLWIPSPNGSGVLTVYSVLRDSIPETKLQAVSELLTSIRAS